MQANTYQIDAKITTLADKLGIERQQLWDAIVRQARVEAWVDIALALTGVSMIVAAAILIPRILKYAKDAGGYDWPAMAIVGMVLCVIGIVAGTVITLINAYDAALIFPNPVFYAYTHLVY